MHFPRQKSFSQKLDKTFQIAVWEKKVDNFDICFLLKRNKNEISIGKDFSILRNFWNQTKS